MSGHVQGLCLRDALAAGPADRGWTLRTPNLARRAAGDATVYVSAVLGHGGVVDHWQWWAERYGQPAVVGGESLTGVEGDALGAVATAERTLGMLWAAGSAR